MLLGFKRRFAPFVEDGSKLHTVRGFRKVSPRVGETCHCYVDPRQKTMRLLGRWPCVRVDPITLDMTRVGISYTLRITIANQTLDLDEACEFAWRDGFRDGATIGGMPTGNILRASLDEMARFWIAAGGLTDALDSKAWHGLVIYWKR